MQAPGGPYATKQRQVYLSDDSFKPEVQHGSGSIQYHAFSTGTFSSPVEAANYTAATGLEDTGVRQNWGATQGNLFRSRRGSIAGLTPLADGKVAAWRWSSYATSRALAVANDPNNTKDPLKVYEDTATDVGSKALNSRNNPISPNAVLSDAGKVRLDPFTNTFGLEDPSYAQGLSGAAVDNSRSSTPADLFAPTINAAISAGKKPTPSYTYHSEGMALTFHAHDRGQDLSSESDLNLMVTSIPNQVCVNCGRALQQNTGPRAFVSGMPGKEFGGQKPGPIAPSVSGGSTVYRSDTTTHLLTDPGNAPELGAVIGSHRTGPMRPGRIGPPPASPTLSSPAFGAASTGGSGPPSSGGSSFQLFGDGK
jgi:hypothetical protein